MRDPACTRCPLHHFATTRCVWGDGPTDAKIMLIGEAPGAEEDKTGRPFQGAAGQVLNRALAEAGLSRDAVYISNVAKCRPPQNRTPTPAEIESCTGFLLSEISQVEPAVIVLLGTAAVRGITGRDIAMATARTQQLTPRRGIYIDAKILPTYHPAATLRPGGQKYLSTLVEDLARAKELSGDARPQPSDHIVLTHAPGDSDEVIIASLRLLQDARPIACDLEWTSGTDSMIWPWSRRGEVYSLSVSGRTGDTVTSVSLAMPLSPRVRAIVGRLLSNRPIVFHNAMADTMWLHALSLDPALAADTMLLAYLLDETQRLNLESIAVGYGGVDGGWKGHLYYRRPAASDEWNELLTYNANDTYATLRSFEGIARTLKRLPLERREAVTRLHRHLLLPAIPVLMRAAYVGVPIDEQRLNDETRRSRERQDAAAEELSNAIGLPPARAMRLATSPKQTLEYLRSLGIELPSSRKDELTIVEEASPVVRMILRIRKEQKLLSTYFEPWTRMLERQGDGRLHTIYRPTGTRTGRLSAESEEGGSLQVAPRDTEDVAFRSLVRAPLGRVIISADFATVEMRIAAWLANEPTMLRFFREGIDLHRATAAYLIACGERGYVVPIGEFMAELDAWIAVVSKEQRQAAKGGNFGLVYGMQEDKLRDYARSNYGVIMTPEESRAMRRGYFALYSAIPAWHERSMENAQRLGYTETPFGRRRTFDPTDVHAAINTPVQSTASDIALLAMSAVARRYSQENVDAVVIGFIHDSILVEASEQHAELATAMLKHEMENVDTSVFGFTLPIPLPADTKIGETWA